MDKMYYSASEKGFYHPDVHGAHGMPADVKEVSMDEYRALLKAQETGKIIVPGAGGKPVAVENVVTEEQKLVQKKLIAREYLNSTDWYVFRKTETGKDIPEDVTQKRAAAREVLSA